MRKFIFFLSLAILFFLVCNLSFGQDRRLDSLREGYKKARGSKSLEGKEKEGLWLNEIGNWFINKGKLDLALPYYNQAIGLLGNSKKISSVYSNMGAIYQKRGEYQVAAEFYHKAMKQDEQNDDKKGICIGLNNLGSVYIQYKKYDQALDYYNQSFELANKMHDTVLLANIYNNIGLFYYESKKDFDSAVVYFNRALKFAGIMKDKKTMSIALENLGNAFDRIKDHKKAEIYYKAALKAKQEIGDKYSIAVNMLNFGDFYLNTNQLDTAFMYFKKALSISQEIGARDLEKFAYLNFSVYYEVKSDYKQSLQYHKLYSSAQDTVFNKQSSSDIAMYNELYESEKKDKKITEQDLEIANKNSLVFKISIGAMICIFIISGLFFYQRNKKNKFKREKVEKELENSRVKVEYENLMDDSNYKSLSIQTDAHALKGVFSSIESYIYAKEPEKAIDVFNHFTKYLTRRYSYLNEVVFELYKEMKIIEHYTKFQEDLCSFKFKTRINIETDVNINEIKVPPLFIYTFVENAIEHGLMHKENNDGLLQILVKKEEANNYICIIEDNGIGLTKSAKPNKNRKSTGMEITKKRIECLKKLSNSNFSFKMEELFDDNGQSRGTRATLYITLS